MEWRYYIPDNRAALRDLCSRTLGLENYFLADYRDYLLQELASKDEAMLRHLLWLLEQIPWQDDEIICAAEIARQKIASPEILNTSD